MAAVRGARGAHFEVVSLNPMFAPALGFDGRAGGRGRRPRRAARAGSCSALARRAAAARVVERRRRRARPDRRRHAGADARRRARVRARAGRARRRRRRRCGAVAPPPHATLLALLARIASGQPGDLLGRAGGQPARGAPRAPRWPPRPRRLADLVDAAATRPASPPSSRSCAPASAPTLDAPPPVPASSPQAFPDRPGPRRRTATLDRRPMMPVRPDRADPGAARRAGRRLQLRRRQPAPGGDRRQPAPRAAVHPPRRAARRAPTASRCTSSACSSSTSWPRAGRSWYLAQGSSRATASRSSSTDSFAYTVHYLRAGADRRDRRDDQQRAPASTSAAALLPPDDARRHLHRPTPAARLVARGRAARSRTCAGAQVADDLPAPPPSVLPDDARASATRRGPRVDPALLGHHRAPEAGRSRRTSSSVAGPRFRMTSHARRPGELMMTALPQSHLGCIAYSSYAVLCGTPDRRRSTTRPATQLLDAISEHRPTAVMALLARLRRARRARRPVRRAGLGRRLGLDRRRDPRGAHPDDPRAPQPGPPRRRPSRPARHDGARLGRPAARQHDDRPRARSAASARRPASPRSTVLRKDGTRGRRRASSACSARKGPAITAGYWNDCDTTYRSRLAGYWLTGRRRLPRRATASSSRSTARSTRSRPRPAPATRCSWRRSCSASVAGDLRLRRRRGPRGDETVAVGARAPTPGPSDRARPARRGQRRAARGRATRRSRCSRSRAPTPTTPWA